MNNYINMHTSVDVVNKNIEVSINRANMPVLKMIFLGIFAGMFISLGAAASAVVMHSIDNVGLARMISGLIFPIGLIMIVLIGGELFTGNCLIIMGVMDKKAKVTSMIRILIIVYISNFIGAMIIVLLVSLSGQYNYSDGLLGAFTIKNAMNKVSMSFGSGFTSGILCNIFVCIPVLMAAAAKDVSGKIWACVFPIVAFVVSGYEHCVANMYFIPAGILAKNNEVYIQKAMDAYGYTAEQLDKLNWSSFFAEGLLPVTLGNMVGGMLFVGVIAYIIHVKNHDKNVKNLTN